MNNTPVWPLLQRSLVAIIRGIRNDEVEPILTVLIEEGFEAIEIPLNSPQPWGSISQAVKLFGDQALIGAGTVLTVDHVSQLADLGGRIMVSPNTDAEVIKAAATRGLYSMPGCYTASEAILALKSGASALKFFPAGTLGPSGIAAIKTILPKDTVIGAVGGVSDKSFTDYAKVGVRTFGLGTSLYRPGDTAEIVRANARRTIAAYDQVFH
ncbi:2-dehydro-3-deoxy-6-phosphogalactonate aldolase [Brucella sp. 21LCYQ03]|nr:2-dehydro-3-deoxy-6-phosphogalactonate aldolase [Brucella sp. 21LCYQ03]